MADKYVRDLLKDLDMEHLINHFKKYGISKEGLSKLTPRAIQNFIPDPSSKLTLLYYMNFKNLQEVTHAVCEELETYFSPGNYHGQYSIKSWNKILNNEDGLRILAVYKSKKILTDLLRTKLVNLILRDIDFADEKIIIDHNIAVHITKQIVQYFPGEVATSYYIPAVSEQYSTQKKNEVSKGKIMTMSRAKQARVQRIKKHLFG